MQRESMRASVLLAGLVLLPVAGCVSPRGELATAGDGAVDAAVDAGAEDTGAPERPGAPTGVDAAPAPSPATDGAAPGVPPAPDGPAAVPGDGGAPGAVPPGTVLWRAPLRAIVGSPTLDRQGNILVRATIYTDDNGGTDLGLAKYTPGGQQIWLKQYGGPGREVTDGLTVAPDGALLLTGEFDAMTDFGGQSRAPVGDRDIFLAAYTAEGALTRVLTFGGPGPEAGNRVIVDAPSGDWLLTGWGGPLMAGDKTVNGAFLIRVSPAGDVRWARWSGTALVTLEGGDLVTGGYIKGLQLARFQRADGAAVWVKDYGPDASIYNVVVNRGNLVAAVTFATTVTLGDQSLTSQGKKDVALVAFSSASGEVLWSRLVVGSRGDDYVAAVCQDAGGDLWVLGESPSGPTFQPGAPEEPEVTSFLARYSSDGTRRSIRVLPFSVIIDMLCSAPGEVIVTYQGGMAKIVP